MKKEYTQPTLVEYGSAAALTLGAGGPKIDYVYNGTQYIDTSNCTNNAGSGNCVTGGPLG